MCKLITLKIKCCDLRFMNQNMHKVKKRRHFNEYEDEIYCGNKNCEKEIPKIIEYSYAGCEDCPTPEMSSTIIKLICEDFYGWSDFDIDYDYFKTNYIKSKRNINNEKRHHRKNKKRQNSGEGVDRNQTQRSQT